MYLWNGVKLGGPQFKYDYFGGAAAWKGWEPLLYKEHLICKIKDPLFMFSVLCGCLCVCCHLNLCHFRFSNGNQNDRHRYRRPPSLETRQTKMWPRQICDGISLPPKYWGTDQYANMGGMFYSSLGNTGFMQRFRTNIYTAMPGYYFPPVKFLLLKKMYSYS